ncbi:hypothetical protein [Streptomyces avermitilis]
MSSGHEEGSADGTPDQQSGSGGTGLRRTPGHRPVAYCVEPGTPEEQRR